ncbi:MAG: 50S ribosomal protein L4 [Nitrospiraceae bacterium]|nr:50S ribosomal protein L4 [Nitrospiraceae bacterium]
MASIEIKDIKNNVVGSMDLSARFSMDGKGALMHEAVVSYLANQRQGTHATKTKGLVSGGGKKPWKQKHTGRARAGSSRSPLWRGGGTVFGPQPRDYSYELPKTARRTALFAAFSRKIKDGEVLVIEGIKFEEPRTKEMVSILKNLGLAGGSTLLIVSEVDRPVVLSARNIPGVSVVCAKDLNIYEVVSHTKVLVTKSAMEVLEARPI